MTTATKHTMTKDELRSAIISAGLTSKQGVFVQNYVESADPTWSAFTAFEFKDKEAARVASYKILSNPKIMGVLSLYFGRTPYDEFKRTLARCVGDKKITTPQIKALELQARVNGWDRPTVAKTVHGHKIDESVTTEPQTDDVAISSETPAAVPLTVSVGDWITLAGETFDRQVIAIDADGRPTEVSDDQDEAAV